MRNEDQHAEYELHDHPAEETHTGDDDMRDDDAGDNDAGDNDAGDDDAEDGDTGGDDTGGDDAGGGDGDAGADNAGVDDAGGKCSGEMPSREIPTRDMFPADDSGVFPMDEDDDGANVSTPRVSRTQKRAIVASPSSKDKSPTKHVKYDRSVCIFYTRKLILTIPL